MAVIFYQDEEVHFGLVPTQYEERGKANVVLGTENLPNVTTGISNVAIGQRAMFSGTEAQSNVGVGASALEQATSASGNVAVGRNSLAGNKTGGGNVAVGELAMAEGVGGEETIANVAVGSTALVKATGKQNVGIGSSALEANKTGSGNVAIGNEAGAEELGSNTLYIANSRTATPLIKGDFSAETLAINGTLTTNHVAPTEIAAGQTYVVREKIQGLWKENISIQGTLNLQGRFDEVGVTESSPWFLPAPVAPTSNVVIPANTQTWFYLNTVVEGTINLQGQLVGIG